MSHTRELKKSKSIAKWFRESILQKAPAKREHVQATTVPSGPKSALTESVEQTADTDLTDLLHEWIWVKSKVNVTLLGEKGVGKSFLLNTLLETTMQDVHTGSFGSLERGFLLLGDDKSAKGLSNLGEGKPEEVYMEESFPSSVNWQNEKETRRNVSSYFETSVYNSMVADRYSYLVPQGPFGGNTLRCYTIGYGKFPELHLTFLAENELRAKLWKLHEVPFQGPDLDYAKRQYRQILELSRDQVVPLLSVSSAQELPIPKHVLELLGRNIVFRGSGHDLNLDRVYIREKLLEVSTRYGHLTQRVYIKMPCGLLEGNKEISVIDPDLSDLQRNRSILQDTNLLLIVIDRRGLTNSLGQVLKHSGYFEKLAAENEERKIAFVDLTEKEEVEGPLKAQQMLYFKTKMEIQGLKQQFISQLKTLILDSKDFPFGALGAVNKTLEQMNIFAVKPLLYISVQGNQQQVLSLKNYKNLTVEQLRQKTTLPLLIAFIQNMVLNKCARPLKDFNKDWMLKDKEKKNIKILHRISTLLKKPYPTAELLLSSLQDHTKSWKNELSEFEKHLFQNLNVRAREYNYQQMFGSNNAFENFILFAAQHWEKNVFEKLPYRMESLLQYSQQLIEECPKAVQFPPTASVDDHTRVLKIMALCKGSTERYIRARAEEILKFIEQADISQMVRLACVEGNDARSPKLKKVPQVTEDAVQSIFKNILECVNFTIRQIQTIEKHIEDTIRCLVFSPNLTASQVMSFLISSQMGEKTTFELGLQESVVNLQQKHGLLELHRTLEASSAKASCESVNYNELIWNELYLTREYNYERFTSQLKNVSLKVVEVDQDCNSQFRSLAHLIFGYQGVHAAVRLLLMHEILNNPSIYTKLLVNRGIDVNEYVYTMSRNNEYGDQLTLFAFANFYNADLYIYSPMLSRPIKISPDQRNNQQQQQRESYYLAYINKNQYQALVPVAEIPELSSVLNVEERLEKLHIEDKVEVREISSSPDEITDNLKTKLVKTERSTLSVRRATSNLKSLSELCLGVICQHVDYLPYLDGALPEELVQKILTLVAIDGKLSQGILERTLDSSIVSLNLEGCLQLSTGSCKAIGQTCTSLRRLNLSNCVNILPEDLVYIISSCASTLENLNLSGCLSVTDDVVIAISERCATLTTIDLTQCRKLTDRGVQVLLSVSSSLREINLTGCLNVTDNSFAQISSNLVSINLAICPHISSNAIVALAKSCRKLTTLKVSGKTFSPSSMEFLFEQNKSLTGVELADCEGVPNKLLNCLATSNPRVSRLSLSGCKGLTDAAFMGDTPKLFSLTYLDLSKCSTLTPRTLAFLSSYCIQLQHINLSGCDELATEQGLISLVSHNKDLRYVNFSGCTRVTDSVLSALAAYNPNLENLLLFNCSRISNSGLYDIANGCYRLRELNLGSCENVTDEGIVQLASRCNKLSILSLEESKITDAGVLGLARYCPDLTHVTFAFCHELTNTALQILVKHCRNIISLDLSYSKNITVEAVNEAIQLWSGLRILHLRGYAQITVEGIQHRNLTSLNLAWCKNLTDTAIAKIAAGSPNLQCLNLHWCSKLTSNSLHTLIKKLPHLQELNLIGATKNMSKRMIQHLCESPGRLIYY